MQRNQLVRQLIGVALIALICQAAGAQTNTDPAQFMPRDTAIYIGWSPWASHDDPELRQLGRYSDAVAGLITQEQGEEEATIAKTLLNLIEPLVTGYGGIGLFDVTMVDDAPVVHLAAVVDAGPNSARLVDTLRELNAAVGDPAAIEPRTVNGVDFECVPLGDSGMVLMWGLHRDCFLFALSKSAAGRVIDCMNGRAETLADAAEFQFNRRKVSAHLDGRYFCMYSDVARILTRGKEIATEVLGELPPIVEPLLDELGLTALRSKYLHVDELEGCPRMMAFAHVDGPLRGLLAMWKQKPLTDADLQLVPANAYWMEVNNLDLAALWNESMRVVGQTAPDAVPQVDGMLAMVAGMLGFSLTEDLLPALGDTWAFFDAPDHGGILMSGTVLVAEVKDREALNGMLTRSIQMVTALLMNTDVRLQPRQTTHGGHTIDYVIIGGQPVPVMPAWSFVDDRFVLGLYPQTVAAALQQVDTRTRGKSILDNADFQAARARLPQDVMGIAYFDSKYLSRLFYPFLMGAQAAVVSYMSPYGVDMDLALFPPVAEQASQVTNYVCTSSLDDEGILYASIGNGAPVTMVAGGAALGTSILLPSLSRARTLAKRAASGANLRGIGQACYLYANDHEERFPDSLERLLEAGLITPEMLLSPLDPQGPVSYVYIAGQSSGADPRNVLAYERATGGEVSFAISVDGSMQTIDPGEAFGEGASVLFVDGHVEWLKPDAFKTAVRETYRRLGREDELPPEFRP